MAGSNIYSEFMKIVLAVVVLYMRPNAATRTARPTVTSSGSLMAALDVLAGLLVVEEDDDGSALTVSGLGASLSSRHVKQQSASIITAFLEHSPRAANRCA